MSLGMGVMLNMLCGNRDTIDTLNAAIGKEIKSLNLSEDWLLFTFADGERMKVFDDGQSCCEERYMHSDDDLQYFVGAELVSIEVKDAPIIEEEWVVHEIQFLVVTTSKGAFTVETHNRHNGYYGGFWIKAVVPEEDVSR